VVFKVWRATNLHAMVYISCNDVAVSNRVFATYREAVIGESESLHHQGRSSALDGWESGMSAMA